MGEPSNEETPEPATPTASVPAAQSENFTGVLIGFIFAPMAGCMTVCTCFFWQTMPLWEAIPLGIVAGFLAFVIGAAIFGGGFSKIVEIGIAGWISLILTVILIPTFVNAKEKARENTCLTNIKALSLGLLMYAVENDDRLPSAIDWSDAVFKVKNRPVFLSEDSLRCPSIKTPFGYAFNKGLSTTELYKIKDLETSLLIYDSTAGIRNASDALTSLPKPGRHRKGNILGYADGHARWVKDDETP